MLGAVGAFPRRVLKPTVGNMAVTVPSCTARSGQLGRSPTSTHDTPGGHSVHSTAARRSSAASPRPDSSKTGYHHAHGLHSPYWWLRCLVGPSNDTHPAVAAYHQVLVWDIVKAPFLAHCAADRVLSPVIGKKPGRLPHQTARRRRRTAGRSGQTACGGAEADAAHHTEAGSSRAVRPRRSARRRSPFRRFPASSDRRGRFLATARAIAGVQRPDGMIPWFEDCPATATPWRPRRGRTHGADRVRVWWTRPRPPTGGWPSCRQLPDGQLVQLLPPAPQ